RVLAGAQHAPPDRKDSRSRARLRRLVRQFRAERSGSLRGHQRRAWWRSGLTPRRHRTVAAQYVPQVRRRRFRTVFIGPRPLDAATSAPDTDFTAKLVDVFPDGMARNLTDGILRLRYRESLEKPVLATPGEPYQITIDAGVTSNVFLKGHRIRLEISSSNFPRFDRNPNTGRLIAEETELRKASQTVYHDRIRPSHVLLPVTAR